MSTTTASSLGAMLTACALLTFVSGCFSEEYLRELDIRNQLHSTSLSYEILRWNPDEGGFAMSIDVMLNDGDLTEESIVRFCEQLGGGRQRTAIIGIYTSKEAYRQITSSQDGEERLSGYICSFSREQWDAPGYIVWHQEVGKFSHKLGTTTTTKIGGGLLNGTMPVADDDSGPATDNEVNTVVDTEVNTEVNTQAGTTPDARPVREFREWTSSVGSTVRAKLLSKTGNTVKLETEDGEPLSVKMEQLSEKDQEYLRGLQEKPRRFRY